MQPEEMASDTRRVLSDEAIAPGEHLADTLRELGMNQSELARKMGRPQQAINEIIRGRKVITPETALQLEDATAVPAHVWVRLEADYQLVKARLGQIERRPAQTRTVKVGRSATAGMYLNATARRASAKTSRVRRKRT